MEQEVPVTIHTGGQHKEPVEKKAHEPHLPKSLSSLEETFTDALNSVRESEPYSLLINGAEQAKEYVRKNPFQAMLISVGAGAIFGLLMSRKR